MARKKNADGWREKEFEERVARFIAEKGLIAQGDCVIAGVSGGADSVCLLLLLLLFRERAGYTLKAVHVEHGIRGEESRRDAAFTQELCGRLGVPCEVCGVHVPEYAAAHGTGIEEAARRLRYDCYRNAAERETGKRVRIALAHHADDNAETVLLWLARGSGAGGLGGMRPVRRLDENAAVIRPLLCVQREEIVRYLSERGQAYREDATNLDTAYSRNRIRHEVLPGLKQVNRQATAHIVKSAEMIGELAEYLEAEVERILPDICVWETTRVDAPDQKERREDCGAAGSAGWRQGAACLLRQELFREYPAVIQKAVVYRVLCEVCGGSRDIGSVHVEAVCGLAGHQTGRRLSLPYRMTAERVYEGVRIRARQQEQEDGMSANGMQQNGMSFFGMQGGECELYPVTEEALKRAESGEESVVVLPDGELRLRVISMAVCRHDSGGETDGEKTQLSAVAGSVPFGQNPHVNAECGKNPDGIYKFGKKKYTKWLDYDKIKGSLQIRRRKSGDYLTIDDQGHRKKLQDYLIAEKIPAGLRDQIWLLTEGSRVIWVIGRRIGADCKIGRDTRRVLEVRMIKEDGDED